MDGPGLWVTAEWEASRPLPSGHETSWTRPLGPEEGAPGSTQAGGFLLDLAFPWLFLQVTPWP